MNENNNFKSNDVGNTAPQDILMRIKSPNLASNIPKPINKRHSLVPQNTAQTNSENLSSSVTSPKSKLPIAKRNSSFNETSTQQQTPTADKMKPVRSTTVTTPVKPSKFQQFKQEHKLNQKTNLEELSATLSSNPKAFQTLLKQSRINGSLNLSNYQLTQIPSKVLRINVDKFEEETNEDHENGFKWWQQIDMQKLILASNKITEIPKDIQFLESLVTFDVSFKRRF